MALTKDLSKGLFSRTRSLVNVLIVIIQGVIVAAFWAMVNSRGDFEDISADIFPNDTYLMNSYISDVFLSPVVASVILVVFITSIVKEFLTKNPNQKLLINFSILFVFIMILGPVSYGLYAPIGN